MRSMEIDQTYQARINPWIDKVGVMLNSIFPTSIEANSFTLSSVPPELIDSQRKLEYSYQYLRLEVFNKVLKTILDGGLEQYTDLPLEMRLYIEEIDSFRKVRDVNFDLVAAHLNDGYLDRSEDAIQIALEQILQDPFHKKDWGGEENDLFTSNIVIQGKRVASAFLLKGNGLKKKVLEIADCGKNGDQIVRLVQSPAQLFIVQFVGEVSENVIKHLEHEVELLRHQDKQAWYCIMKGQDTARVLYAYNKL